MTKKFDTLCTNLLLYAEMDSASVLGPASAAPYDTSDVRTPKVLGKIRKRKITNKCGCK
jgi:hypothetical protein